MREQTFTIHTVLEQEESIRLASTRSNAIGEQGARRASNQQLTINQQTNNPPRQQENTDWLDIKDIQIQIFNCNSRAIMSNAGNPITSWIRNGMEPYKGREIFMRDRVGE